MEQVDEELNRKVRAAQASITSLSIFVALSMAVIGLVVLWEPIVFGYNATVVSSISLTLAIALFFIALEFFILCIYHSEYIDWFGLLGSCLYGLGATCMMVGISISLTAFGIRQLSFIFLSVTLVGYLVYYALRMSKLGREDRSNIRLAFRGVCISVLVIGYFLLFSIGG
jgi:hypothetical protein